MKIYLSGELQPQGKSFNVGTNQKKLYAAKMPEHF